LQERLVRDYIRRNVSQTKRVNINIFNCVYLQVLSDMWCKELGGKNCEYTCQILFSLVSDDVETDCDDKPMMEKRKWSQNEFFYAPI